jgi:DNA polymerase-1
MRKFSKISAIIILEWFLFVILAENWKKMNQKRLFLLDAYALIFRAYYALIRMPRITQSGFNTSAIFGFVNTLEELFKKENPSHIAVCFDPQGPTFRHKTMESYKGEREATPEDIKLSIPIIKDIIRAYNIPILEVDGYEADDVIGTMARKAEKEGYTVYMMTPDKDFGQLVSPNILQYKPAYKGQDFELRGEEEVCNKYGLEKTSQVIDLLALMGDKIDNIPGCPGVGEKTAVKLIQEYGSVENLLASTESVKGALRKKIEDNVEQIKLSKYLATICTDVPVDANPADLVHKEPDRDKLFALFRNLEFKTLADRVARRLDSDTAKTATVVESVEPIAVEVENKPVFNNFEKDCVAVEDSVTLEKMQAQLLKSDTCGISLVLEGESDMAVRWLATAVACESGKTFYIPNEFAEGVAAVLDLLARKDIQKVSRQVKREYVASSLKRKDGVTPIENYYDITLAHYLLQPEFRHDLSTLASTYLHMDMSGETDKPKAARSLFDEDDSMMRGACEEARVILLLKDVLDKEIHEAGMESLLYDMEFPLARVLADMEIVGVRIDVKALNDAADILSSKISGIEHEIHTLAGEEFNVSSPAKVGEILFDKLKLDEKAKKTKSGQYSTGEAILEKVAYKHPIVNMILEYRQLKKLLTTYLTALPEAINPATGRVHTNYNQTVTATGRISSSNPNLQNIPVRDDVGREIRRSFIADDDCVFLSADYSQIELRIVADLAGDEVMLDAFRHDKDIHAITAAKIYGIPVEEVSANQRRNAKTANFGILYGISAFGLAARLNIPRYEAKMLIDGYNSTFPKVHQYMTETVEHARENGFVATIMGRKRMQPDINSRNPVVRGYAERNAINAPIQGSAADIIKVAMVNIHREMTERNLKSKMIMQVHDELNFNVVKDELPIVQELVVRNMENAYHGNVRLIASCGVGPDWLSAH